MDKGQLIKKLKKEKGKKILAYVDGLYMPIQEVTTYDGYVIIKIKDIRGGK